MCCVARGERTPEAFAALPEPDYAPLLSPSFWINGGKKKAQREEDPAPA